MLSNFSEFRISVLLTTHSIMTFNKEMEQDSLLSEDANRPSFSDSDTESQNEKRPFLRPFREAVCSKLFPWQAILLHASILIIYTILLLLIVAPLWKRREREVVYNSNIRITEDEMSHIPGRKEQAIELPDGGYFATLNVYHNLHCIKRLHHYMYPDYYFPNITEEQKRANEYHNHHCLDMVRQSIMCQGDMQLLTMKWRQDGRIPTANFTSPHQCVNWDRLEEWATSRRIVNLMEPGYLNHPTLGPAYPGGHGDLIGEFLPQSNASTSE
ncbi:hypothetical protein FBULB1_9670 [Fusarium bulbicola]|nr:hypothetical protein FBULB1_9670 [Fusarium bulbicola]